VTRRRGSPETTRVLLAVPGLLSEIIKDAGSKHGDIDFVGDLQSLGEVPAAMRATAANAVVCSLPGAALPTMFNELLAEHPHARIVAIDADGRHSTLYELRLQRTALGELSPDELLDAIRRRGAV
jgi:DNA-binding NarL/FixJ family response regulator